MTDTPQCIRAALLAGVRAEKMDVVLLLFRTLLALAQAASCSPSAPILPVTLEIKDVPQYFRLQKTVSGGDSALPQGSMTQSHSETFFIPRLGAREPHVRASLQHVQSQKNIPWEMLETRLKGIKGEVVSGEVSPSDPVARVLFHRLGIDEHSKVSRDQCVTVQAAYEALSVQGSCRLQLPLDVCVVELHFPPPWFLLDSTHVNISLNYSVSEDCKYSHDESEIAGIVQMMGMSSPKVQHVNVGDFMTITLPDKTLLPGEVFTASVSLRHNWTQPSFTLRLRCRIGLELLFARSAAPNTWAIKTDIQRGAKHHTITGHLTQRGASDLSNQRLLPSSSHLLYPQVALLDFLVSNVSVGFAVSRRITFQLDISGGGGATAGVRSNIEVLVSDHDLKAIIPLVKSHEILNTAPLTGISQKIPVRVFALEAGGFVMDVTKEAGCETPNAQIIQVSDACDFLFVGGKETQGAVGVKVEFWLERLRSSITLSLWVPLLPLRVEVSDTNLQRLPGSRSFGNTLENENDDYRRSTSNHKGHVCRPQYQRAFVRFLANFVAHSLDGSNHLTYLLGSDWMLDVSPLIRSQAVVSDQRIARLEEEGSVLIGQQPGVTSVEVRSPLSHSILGEQTISVSPETVSILELRSNLLWGIYLSVTPTITKHYGVFNISYMSQEARMIPKQEAILSVWLIFSDMSVTPITIYNPQELSLSVVSSDPSVLSVGRTVMSPNYWSLPVIIFENLGDDPLLRMSLFLPEKCREKETNGLLSVGYTRVTFKRNGTITDEHPERDIIQGDTVLLSRDRDIISSANNVIPGTNDIILRSDHTTIEDDRSHAGADDIVTTRWGIPGLDKGLYGLLAIFSLLTLLFLFSCLAFIRKYRKKSAHDGPGNPEAPNWVWLDGSDADEPKSQGTVGEEEERGQWFASNLGSQTLTSTFHPVRNFQEAETNSECQLDASSFSTSTNHAMAFIEALRSEVKSLKTTPPSNGGRRFERVTYDPNMQSIMVASDEDIVWVCKDMGLREPQEILSYMEKVRAETHPQNHIKREGLKGRGIEIMGTRVKKNPNVTKINEFGKTVDDN
ncbi:transmembrane protein 132A isoform 2-T2 [Anomaloglossus baeobatrachus]|uniref:transmembrane protein 132A isoform X2 n=1 Tax=Anomaloglossus baeobatrachus TaxID=238106 RepID=UPI003F4F7B97